jgi:hypothetical protein
MRPRNAKVPAFVRLVSMTTGAPGARWIELMGPSGIGVLAECATFDHAGRTVVALWRAPERVSGAKAWEGPSHLVDVTTVCGPRPRSLAAIAEIA